MGYKELMPSHALAHFLEKCAVNYSLESGFTGGPNHSPGYHTTIPDGVWVHSTRLNFDYALALLESNSAPNLERAAAVLERLLDLQDTDPVHGTYGIWPWFTEEPLPKMAPPDWNWADFCGARLAHMLLEYPDRLSPALRARTAEALGHAGWAIFRRNVQPGYTNIAIMGGGVALFAGAILGEAQLVQYGRRRLERFVEYTAEHGDFNEYNSPAYTTIALEEVERILQLARDEAARDSAEAIRRHAWKVIAEHYHPATGQWAGPHSRTYSDTLTADKYAFLETRLGFALKPGGERVEEPWSPIRSLPCPAEIRDRFRRLPEPEVRLRQRFDLRLVAAEDRSLWGSTWLTEGATLASINSGSFWTQSRPLVGYWNAGDEQPAVLRTRFLHDGRDFASALISNAQAGPRVLSGISFSLDRGDFHPSLDRSKRPVFPSHDLRLRFELTHASARAEQTGGNQFQLSAGEYRAEIHALPGRFGPHEVRWELGGEAGRVWLDGICYAGPRADIDLAVTTPVSLVTGLEIVAAGETGTEASPRIEGKEVVWGKELKLAVE